MVTWTADGTVSLFQRLPASETLPDLYPANAANDELPALASGGSVDANAITRLQYPLETLGGDPLYYLRLSAPILYGSGDVTFAAGRRMTVTMFMAPASAFPEGITPVPSQIMPAATIIKRSATFRTTEGSNNFSVAPDERTWEPNRKWWVLMVPTAVSVANWSLPASTARDTPIGNPNVHGRAISIWTNRTPEAPKIASPAPQTQVVAGQEIDFEFVPQDPDRITPMPGDAQPHNFDDLAGVQVQYRNLAVSEDTGGGSPLPSGWADLPITSVYEPNMQVGSGWHIDRAEANTLGLDSGARQLWMTYRMKIRCGASDLAPGRGILPAGKWEIRCRTFDYGHPQTPSDDIYSSPNPNRPLGQRDGLYTPDTYPAVNTSPWSAPVTITVSPQVPQPLPVYPTNNIAVVADSPVSLSWQFRNTNPTPRTQLYRTVRIRKVGGPWTTLVSGVRPEPTHPLTGAPPNLSAPGGGGHGNSTKYLTNGDFEGANWNADAWLTTAANGIGVAPATQIPPYTGGQSLKVNDVNPGINPAVYRYFDLTPGHKFVSVSAQVRKGLYTGLTILQVGFQDANGQQVGPSPQVNSRAVGYTWNPTTGSTPAPFYEPMQLREIPIPDNAVRLAVFVSYSSDSFIHEDDALDLVSVFSAPSLPIQVTPLPTPLVPDIPPSDYVLEEGVQYQWQVRVGDTDGISSDWSPIASFWAVPAPVSGPVRPVPTSTIEGASLGCGTHRVFIFRRGGLERVGEITEISSLDWSRVRDDISTAKVVVSGWSLDCGALLADLQTWAYEVVIFRDNGFSVERVWEGPITLLTFERESVTIHAKDVMAYAYRRIIKQAVNDNGANGGATVVNRATRILQYALAPDDPNVLAYLTPLVRSDDAMQYRSLPAYSRTAYEEVDDMAANAGLDYTCVGRRVMLWGTKHRIGTLPEFRDENLGSSPIVSEYGMSMANVYSVSDGTGVYGVADRLDENDEDPIYGLVEMLSSSWASDSENEAGDYTEEGLETIRQSFTEFAERSIADRYPPPVVVRVPDNTTLLPDTVLSIQQLVPGVVIPLRSTGTLRSVVASQKLDSVRVVEQGGAETISITLSPFSRDDTEIPEEEG